MFSPGASQQFGLVVMLAALAVGGSDAAAKDLSFSLDIKGGVLPAQQRSLKVTKDDSVRLMVSTDAPGELHLHGYKLERKLVPGKPVQIDFKAFATGRYPLEWHASSGSAKGSARHHGPDFAVLDVHPK